MKPGVGENTGAEGTICTRFELLWCEEAESVAFPPVFRNSPGSKTHACSSSSVKESAPGATCHEKKDWMFTKDI